MKFTEKQKEIIELSKEMFSEKGYVETSMRDLAFQLDIKAASIYSHFKSKEEILQIICNEIYEEMVRNMTVIQSMQGGAEEKFMQYVKVHIETIVQKQKSFNVYNKYWNLLDGGLSGKYGMLNYEYFDFVKKIVNDMFPENEELACYIPNAFPLFMIDMLNSLPRLINPENPDIDMVVKDIQIRLLYGFSAERM